MKNASLAAANRRYRRNHPNAADYRWQRQKDGSRKKVSASEPAYAEEYERWSAYSDATARAERAAGG